MRDSDRSGIDETTLCRLYGGFDPRRDIKFDPRIVDVKIYGAFGESPDLRDFRRGYSSRRPGQCLSNLAECGRLSRSLMLRP